MLFWGELLLVPSFVSEKCHVRVNVLSRLVSWWTAALCLAIPNPFRKLSVVVWPCVFVIFVA